MSQDDLVIANQTFPATRSDINANLQALGSLMSGASAPGTTYAYMYWADTTNGVLKQRDASNAAWVIRATLSDDRVVTKTSAYTVVLGDFGKTILCSASGAAFTVTLLAAATAGDGFRVAFKKTDSSVNAVTIDGNGAETIDGATTVTLDVQYDSFELVSDGSNWHIENNAVFTMTRPEVTIASAATTDLGTKASNMLAISGTTTITALGSSASLRNPVYFLRFTGALTLTHNATSLIIPGGSNIVTADGDTAIALYLGSGNWKILSYTRANGQGASMAAATVAIASAGTTDIGSAKGNLVNITGTTTITALGSTATTGNPLYFARFTGALTLTHNGTSLILPGSANITTAAGDSAIFEYLGSGNWRCLNYAKIDGSPVVGSSALVKISTQTASASANIDFTGLSSTYKKYILEIIDYVPSAAQSVYLRVDAGSGFISTGTYDQAGDGRDSEGNPVTLEAENAAQISLTGADTLATTSTNPNYLAVEIINPSHSKRTAIGWRGHWIQDGTTRHRTAAGFGSNQATTAVISIRILPSTGNISSGTFILYGVV